MFSTWRVAWIAHQLPRDPLHLLDTNILYPARGTAVFSDAAPLLGLMAAPLIWLGAPAVYAYNVMLLAAFVTAALGAFLLVRELTGSAAAGIFAGIVFAFSPFRFEHYKHLEIVWSCWIPLSLWALHRTIATGRWLFGILTGLFIAAQVFSCVYLAVFLATWLVVIGILMLAFRMLDVRSQAFRALVAGAIIGGVLVAPYGSAYMGSSRIVGTRSTEETQLYSAQAVNYLASPPVNRLYGWTAASWGQNEKALFPGVTAIVLAIVGLWPPLCRRRLLYALALLFAFDLSRGLYGFTYGPLRDTITFFQGLRVAARAATMVQLALAVLGGYGIARLLGVKRGTDERAVPAIGAAMTAVAMLLTIVEYTNRPIPLTPLQTTAHGAAVVAGGSTRHRDRGATDSARGSAAGRGSALSVPVDVPLAEDGERLQRVRAAALLRADGEDVQVPGLGVDRLAARPRRDAHRHPPGAVSARRPARDGAGHGGLTGLFVCGLVSRRHWHRGGVSSASRAADGRDFRASRESRVGATLAIAWRLARAVLTASRCRRSRSRPAGTRTRRALLTRRRREIRPARARRRASRRRAAATRLRAA